MLSSDLCVAGLIPPPMPLRLLRTSSTCAHYGDAYDLMLMFFFFPCSICGPFIFTKHAVFCISSLWAGNSGEKFPADSVSLCWRHYLPEKKVRLGFIVLAILVRFPTRISCSMFAAFLATVQVTLLLFARLERSRTPTLNACRAIAPLGHRNQIVYSPWPPFPPPPPPPPHLSSRRFGVPAFLSKHLHASLLCTIPAPRGGISDFLLLLVGGCNTLIVDCWLDLRGR